MAYAEFNISTVTEIPALVASFAISVGWTVSGTTVTRPGGGLSFTVTATIGGTNNQNHDVLVSRADDSTLYAITRSPKLNGTNANPIVSLPSKLFMIGGLTPEPYIAAVIEYGFNNYRHMYIGNLEKLGSFDGGEVISATAVPQISFTNTSASRNYRDQKYLFTARQDTWAADASGGAHIDHPDNPTPWRRFRGPFSVLARNNLTANQCVIGGFSDGPNDPLLARGKSDWAGAQILVPINLWAVRDGSGVDVTFSPIGRPAGIRVVNMEDLAPGSSISVGNLQWRVFPALRKSLTTTIVAPINAWPPADSSYFVGYAYLEG